MPLFRHKSSNFVTKQTTKSGPDLQKETDEAMIFLAMSLISQIAHFFSFTGNIFREYWISDFTTGN